MHAGRITNTTRVLGKPIDWKPEDGRCGGLAIRDEASTAGPCMTSAWFPTIEEIERMKSGAPIYLTVLGQAHPPVILVVGEVPVGN